jgi:hypothetical protein
MHAKGKQKAALDLIVYLLIYMEIARTVNYSGIM